jgi:hypothetical protein
MSKIEIHVPGKDGTWITRNGSVIKTIGDLVGQEFSPDVALPHFFQRTMVFRIKILKIIRRS